MTEQMVLSLENVVDAHQCQDYLRTLGEVFGAKVSNRSCLFTVNSIKAFIVQVFEYSDTEQMCKLYDTEDKECDAMSGPKTPNVNECNILWRSLN